MAVLCHLGVRAVGRGELHERRGREVTAGKHAVAVGLIGLRRVPDQRAARESGIRLIQAPHLHALLAVVAVCGERQFQGVVRVGVLAGEIKFEVALPGAASGAVFHHEVADGGLVHVHVGVGPVTDHSFGDRGERCLGISHRGKEQDGGDKNAGVFHDGFEGRLRVTSKRCLGWGKAGFTGVTISRICPNARHREGFGGEPDSRLASVIPRLLMADGFKSNCVFT